MSKEDIIRWLAGFCPSIEIDGDKVYLDNDHLLVYLEPADGKLTIGSEIHDARMTFNIDAYDYNTADKLTAIWSEFMDLNNDNPRTTLSFLPSV